MWAVDKFASSGGSPGSGLEAILRAIGQEAVNGTAHQLDVLALQEVKSQATTTQAVVKLLNSIYGAGTYARGNLNGTSTGSGTQGLVYRTSTVQLLSEAAIGTASSTGQPRQALRYRLHPIGFSSQADFYLYNSHYKSGSSATDQNRRQIEATAIRHDADALGQGVQILYVGDFNSYSSSETFYQTLLAAGNGEAFDPVNSPGTWHNNVSFKVVHSQAPAVSPASPLTGGGMDDRFDFQVFSGELTDGFGIDYVASSYHAFGNNGTHTLNGNINDPSNTALPGLPNRTTVLNLLTTVSDHLPVVADYFVHATAGPLAARGGTSDGGIEPVTVAALLSVTTGQEVTAPIAVSASSPDSAIGLTIADSPTSASTGQLTGTISIDTAVGHQLDHAAQRVIGSVVAHSDSDSAAIIFDTATTPGWNWQGVGSVSDWPLLLPSSIWDSISRSPLEDFPAGP